LAIGAEREVHLGLPPDFGEHLRQRGILDVQRDARRRDGLVLLDLLGWPPPTRVRTSSSVVWPRKLLQVGQGLVTDLDQLVLRGLALVASRRRKAA